MVVDLETTGLDPERDELISFAAIPIIEGRIRPGELVTTLVRPARPPRPEGIRIHGLRERDLADEAPIEERLDLIDSALRDTVMVAHCAWIETRFLAAAFASRGRSPVTTVIDTMTLGTEVLGARGITCENPAALGEMARALGLPVHRPHHADGDALTTAQVFLALASWLHPDGEATIGELARAGGRRRGGRLRNRLTR
jgi:DNA polymerase-3 subunit epsilon